MLTQLERHPKVVGAKQTVRALNAGTVRLVFLAEDADPAVTSPVEALCREQLVEVEWVQTMRQLGQACGIAVGSAVAAVIG